MIDIIRQILTPEVLTVIFIGGILVATLTGFHIAIVITSLGFVLGLLTIGPITMEIMYGLFVRTMINYTLLAIPMFIFMGNIIQRSGIADSLYEQLYVALGPLRGGLAIGTILFGTILAACMGIIAASVSMMVLLGLAPMIKRGYAKDLATGSVAAGGCLGILIPPSIMIVVYGPMAEISVGKLFMAAFPAGLMLALLYCLYIVVRTLLRPNDAPGRPAWEPTVSTGKKIKGLIVSLAPPVILILSVLGSIFFGLAAPTEAAGVGATASVLLALAYRKMSFKVLKETTLDTFRVSGYIFFLTCLILAAIGIFMRLGCQHVVANVMLNAPGGRWGFFGITMFFVFALGFFMGWMPILFIVVPVVSPLIEAAGFDPIWFAIMVMVNLQAAFMTPPMALAIFLVKQMAPPELGITTLDVIKGVAPFVGMILLTILLLCIFPSIVTWLPEQMITPWT